MAKLRPRLKKIKQPTTIIIKRNRGPVYVKRETSRAVVPWISKMEWDKVKECIFSSDIKRRKTALNRICAWKSRCHPTIPLGVEVTEDLLTARLEDLKTRTCKHPQRKHKKLVNMYGMAIIRFVNLVTEMGQKGQAAKPVHVVAESMDLPEWLVELRHDACHTNAPSLTALQAGYREAIKWIKKHYWDKESCRTGDEFKDKQSEKAPIKQKGIQKSWVECADKVVWKDYPLGTLPSHASNVLVPNMDLPDYVDTLYKHKTDDFSDIDNDDDDENDSDISGVDCSYQPKIEERLEISRLTVSRCWDKDEIESILRKLVRF